MPQQQYGQQQYGQQPGWSDWGTAAPAPRPGVVPLRPLGVGEILDGAISAFRAHPKVNAGDLRGRRCHHDLITVLLAVTLLDDASAGLSDPAVTPDSEELADILAALSTYTVMVLLLTGVATIVLTGLVTVVVSRAVLGQPITTREAWRATVPRLGQLLLVGLLLLLAFAAIVALAVVPIVLLAVVSTPAAVLGGLVLVPLAVCATVYVWVMFSLSTPAVVLERQGAIPALRRSAQLVRVRSGGRSGSCCSPSSSSGPWGASCRCPSRCWPPAATCSPAARTRSASGPSSSAASGPSWARRSRCRCPQRSPCCCTSTCDAPRGPRRGAAARSRLPGARHLGDSRGRPPAAVPAPARARSARAGPRHLLVTVP
jgi:hypothetical protein